MAHLSSEAGDRGIPELIALGMSSTHFYCWVYPTAVKIPDGHNNASQGFGRCTQGESWAMQHRKVRMKVLKIGRGT